MERLKKIIKPCTSHNGVIHLCIKPSIYHDLCLHASQDIDDTALSSTLNQASATTSHFIVPSRGNGKFTCLGFVGGCLWAWLYWSGSWIYDSWNGLSSSHIQKWSSHYHLFLGKRLLWCLPIILIYETYLLLVNRLEKKNKNCVYPYENDLPMLVSPTILLFKIVNDITPAETEIWWTFVYPNYERPCT